jgi:tRNA 2-thiouridine synthesizing protein B
MLHIIKTQSAIADAMSYVSDNDAILLVEDAVYVSNTEHSGFTHLSKSISQCFVLEADLNARGVVSFVNSNIQVVDFLGWVALTEQYQQSMTWE